MANYKCSKCGTTAYSKCAASRNVFGTKEWHHRVTILEQMIQYRESTGHVRTYVPMVGFELWGSSVIREDKDTPKKQYIPDWRAQEDKEEDEALNLLKMIRDLTDEEMRAVVCRHDWELQDEKCSLGCCKRRAVTA